MKKVYHIINLICTRAFKRQLKTRVMKSKSFHCGLIALAVVLLFSSCAQEGIVPNINEQSREDIRSYINEKGEVICTGASIYACIHNDTVYYLDKENDSVFEYQNVKNLQEEGMPVFNDTLALEGEDPFKELGGGNVVFFLIDKKATYENDDRPVLTVCYRCSEFDEKTMKGISYDRIVSFNTATNGIDVIADRITEGRVQSMYMYKDHLFYTTNEGELGYNIHHINRDGSGYIKLDNPEHKRYMIQTVYDDKVYFISAGTDELYSCDLNLEDQKYLFDALMIPEAFASDGYIYYSGNVKTQTLDSDSNGRTLTFTYFDICRRPIDDITKEETVIEDVHRGIYYSGKFYYFHFSPKLLKEGLMDEGTSVLYCYDTYSGETEVIYDIGDEKISRAYLAWGEDYIIIRNIDYGSGEKNSYMTYIDLKTGEEDILPT